MEIILELEEPLGNNDPAFMAWQRGLLKAQIEVREKLYEQAMEGRSAQAIVTFMKLFENQEPQQ